LLSSGEFQEIVDRNLGSGYRVLYKVSFGLSAHVGSGPQPCEFARFVIESLFWDRHALVPDEALRELAGLKRNRDLNGGSQKIQAVGLNIEVLPDSGVFKDLWDWAGGWNVEMVNWATALLDVEA